MSNFDLLMSFNPVIVSLIKKKLKKRAYSKFVESLESSLGSIKYRFLFLLQFSFDKG